MGIAIVVLVVQLSALCFTAFGDAIETVPPIPPQHYATPAPAPTHHRHRGHAHSHPPSQPPIHFPIDPPIHTTPPPAPLRVPTPPIPPPLFSSPESPPSHHRHRGHAHSHPPSQPPSHIPIDPLIHFTPSPAPLHPPTPPSHPPVHPPNPSPPHPPVKPPARSPPPHPVPRKLVAVQGVVYCKSCKHGGADTLLGATPILGATVKLECNNTRRPLLAKATTDKNGYFFLEAPKKITSYGAHKCKVSLVSSPDTSCNKPTDLNGGVTGGLLRPEEPYFANQLPFVLFTVGPFAFTPKCPL